MVSGPGAVLVQTVKGGAEGQQMPGDGPGQRGPAHGYRAEEHI